MLFVMTWQAERGDNPMDQPILSTKKSRYMVPPVLSGRGRGLDRSSVLGNVRVTDAQWQALLVSVDALMLLTSLYAAWRLTHLEPIPWAGALLPELSFGPPNWVWGATLVGTWFLVGW